MDHKKSIKKCKFEEEVYFTSMAVANNHVTK